MSAIRDNFNSGQAGASSSPAASSASTAGGVGPPAWAKAMKRRQAMMHGASVATHTLRSGDSHGGGAGPNIRSEEHTSELQSLMRISYAVFCWKKKNTNDYKDYNASNGHN